MDSFIQPVRSIHQYVVNISHFLILPQFYVTLQLPISHIPSLGKCKYEVNLFVIYTSRQTHKSYLLMICHPTMMERDGMMRCSGKFLSSLGQNPSVSKSNWLHVMIS